MHKNNSSRPWFFIPAYLLTSTSTVLSADINNSPHIYRGAVDKNIFSQPLSSLSAEQKLDFSVGKGLFKRLWVTAPASTQAADGLGPLYNARACSSCHPRNGRGKPPTKENMDVVSMVLRIDIPAQNQAQKKQLARHKKNNIADPVYGLQLQHLSVAGHKAESSLQINYDEIPLTLNDATIIRLRKPEYQPKDLAYGPMHPDVRLSPRVAPQIIGLGLLEAITDKTLSEIADPEDSDDDGISGRLNLVWSREHNKVMYGRFGHKAGIASINEQSQAALNTDIGISTPLFPDAAGDCTPLQHKCINAPNGNSPQYNHLEAHQKVTELVSFYIRQLAVPAQRTPDDADVKAGEKLFTQIGCQKCHIPQFEISINENEFENKKTQTLIIHPYTDLMLHDMGEGLADHRPEGLATGREWRTAPLWGTGLIPVVNGHSYYLHDGRAANILEAILWHGGEAQSQRDTVMALKQYERKQLLKFIESL